MARKNDPRRNADFAAKRAQRALAALQEAHDHLSEITGPNLSCDGRDRGGRLMRGELERCSECKGEAALYLDDGRLVCAGHAFEALNDRRAEAV